MPNYFPSITEDQVLDALGVFLAPLCGNASIQKTQQNRINPQPATTDAYVRVTPSSRTKLRTAYRTLQDAIATGTSLDISTGMQLTVQVDLYGPASADWVTALETVWGSPYPSTILNPFGVAPLTLGTAIQGQLTDAEKQFEDRWTVSIALQYNPIVTVPVQSATQLAVTKLEDIN